MFLLAVGVAAVPSGVGAAEPVTPDTTTDEACVMTYEGDTTCYDSADALFTALTGEESNGMTTTDFLDPAVIEKIEAGLQTDAGSFARAEAAAGDYLNALFYDGSSFGGSILSMTSPYKCDTSTDVDISWSALTPTWQNRINSGKGYNYCDFKVFDYTNYGGASYGYVTQSADFGAMNNAAVSVRMR